MDCPKIIDGGKFSDDRGIIFFNNTFNASEIKRIYFIENNDTEFIRGWTGHKIEQRWFTALSGSFIIWLIKVDDWNNPNEDSEILNFELSSEKLDVLHMPKGYVSAIQAAESTSKLLVMVNFSFGEVDDDYRFPIDYFKKL